MKPYRKVIGMSIIIVLFLILIGNPCYAYQAQGTDGGPGSGSGTTNVDRGDDPIKNPDAYKPNGDLVNDSQKLIDIGNIVIGAIRIVGTVVAVVALMVIGLRYMFGSVAEKANYKETMIPYLIGAILVFTIPNILGVIYDLVTSIQM